MTTTALAAAVRAAKSTPATGSSRDVRLAESAIVTLFGSAAGLVYELDETEASRRVTEQVEPLTDLAVLDVLMGMPVGLPVALEDLTDREREILRRCPPGAVDVDGGQLVRRAVPPLSVHLAVVAARDWKVGLRRAGRFAPFCARMILLPTVPADPSELHVRASFYGCGVGVLDGQRLQVAVEPGQYTRRRHTPAQWRFAEQAYAEITACATGWSTVPEPTTRATQTTP
ncbi:hypothetical protein ACFXGA_00860 [Actinosynnema sp. NPDC059335]|uniref:hypothetical protein n=1 Tax=Actinosynnema sp. NPDC059335 TaxID=3346804 RepID=UPI00366F8F38